MTNEVIHNVPVEMMEQFMQVQKRSRFSRTIKDENKSKISKPISIGCHNCTCHLSEHYYWKESPCVTCVRSPAYYYRIDKNYLVDHWQPTQESWISRGNLLY